MLKGAAEEQGEFLLPDEASADGAAAAVAAPAEAARRQEADAARKSTMCAHGEGGQGERGAQAHEDGHRGRRGGGCRDGRQRRRAKGGRDITGWRTSALAPTRAADAKHRVGIFARPVFEALSLSTLLQYNLQAALEMIPQQLTLLYSGAVGEENAEPVCQQNLPAGALITSAAPSAVC